jgi:hypothetical protein
MKKGNYLIVLLFIFVVFKNGQAQENELVDM